MHGCNLAWTELLWPVRYLDGLSVMRVGRWLKLFYIIIVGGWGSSRFLSFMIVVIEVWINWDKILFFRNMYLLFCLFALVWPVSVLGTSTSLGLFFRIFASSSFRLGLWWSSTPYQLLMMSLQCHVWIQLVHDLCSAFRSTSSGKYHRDIDFSWNHRRISSSVRIRCKWAAWYLFHVHL